MESYETYNSNETGSYVKFLLDIGNHLHNSKGEKCEKHNKYWSLAKNYPSDDEKHFGYKKKGMEAFF